MIDLIKKTIYHLKERQNLDIVTLTIRLLTEDLQRLESAVKLTEEGTYHAQN
jgi:hypothetical protein